MGATPAPQSRAVLAPLANASRMPRISGASTLAGAWRCGRSRFDGKGGRWAGLSPQPARLAVPRPNRSIPSIWNALSWPWQNPTPYHASSSFSASMYGMPYPSRRTVTGPEIPGTVRVPEVVGRRRPRASRNSSRASLMPGYLTRPDSSFDGETGYLEPSSRRRGR